MIRITNTYLKHSRGFGVREGRGGAMELEEMAINESLPAAGLEGDCLLGKETSRI